MNNEIQVFRNPKINAALRTVMRDGEPWFVAADVCFALDIVDVRQAVERLDLDERGAYSIPTPGGRQNMRIVSEPGLYRLVFQSSKFEAKAFQRWVMHDVLPSIRKTGSYSFEAPIDPFAMVDPLKTPGSYAKALRAAADAAEALEFAEAAAARAKAQAAAAQAKTQAVIAYAKPRVDFARRVARTTDEHTLRETAKLLGMPPKHLADVLVRLRVLYRSNKRLMPHQQHVKNGSFRMRIIENDYGTYSQPVVTRTGLARISSLLGRA